MSEGAIKQNLLRNKRKYIFMVRIGRRTLIDKKKFQKWIDRQS